MNRALPNFASTLERVLGERIRIAINDPSRHVERRNTADDHQVEPLAEWAARAVVAAIELGLFENDLKLITGEQLWKLQQTPVPGPESAAAGPTHPPEGPDGVETPNGPHRANRPAPLIDQAIEMTMHVRDFMDATGYECAPDRPLHEQVRECCQVIRDFRAALTALQAEFGAANDRYAADRQRLTDLADELGKHRDFAVRRAEVADNRAEEIAHERDDERSRVANLDRLLQERDHLIAAACPCQPGAPKHEHLTGGYALDWMTEVTP